MGNNVDDWRKNPRFRSISVTFSSPRPWAVVSVLLAAVLGFQAGLSQNWWKLFSDGTSNKNTNLTSGLHAHLSICPISVAQYEGCEDHNHVRPVACFPRDPPPPAKPCSQCSRHVHLAPGYDSSLSITVSYTIDYSCGKHVDTYVMVGEDPANLDLKFMANHESSSAQIRQYTSTACMAEDPTKCHRKGIHWCHTEHFGTYQSDWYFHVPLTGLRPQTTYYYMIYPPPCQQHDVFTFRFKTAPVKGEGYGLTLAVLADAGLSDDTTSTLHHISSDPNIHGMIIAGDIGYPERNHRVWDEWFHEYEFALSRIPTFTSPGNHDMDTDCCDWTTFKAYEHRFYMPQVQPAVMTPACHEREAGPNYNVGSYDYGNAFYSAVMGPVHIIVLNTYTYSKTNSKQYQWLVQELQSVDRILTPWLFVVAHANIYETFKRHLDEYPQRTMKNAMESLFNMDGVNIFFS